MDCIRCTDTLDGTPGIDESADTMTGYCFDCRKNWGLCNVCNNNAIPPVQLFGNLCWFCSWTGHPPDLLALDKELLDLFDRIFPSKKDYGDECPCGLHPSQCDYHR
jgi:hypothetical protein